MTERRLFLSDCQIRAAGSSAGTFARITHIPTGITAEGEWSAAVAELGRKLVARGDISVNDARAAMGLPEWREDVAGKAPLAPLPPP